MVKAISKYGFVWLFASLILSIYLQGAFEVIKEPKLRRELDEISKPSLTLESWSSGYWQNQVSDYAKREFGFFNSAFLEYNQLDYSIFRKANAKDVIIGKDGYLYEKDYIDAFYGRDLLSDSILDNKVKKLGLIKDYLDSNGVELFVIFAPGKASYYPEHIPDFYRDSLPDKTNYTEFKRRYLENSIPFIDMRKWFVEMKDTSRFPLVSQTGIHWSYYGMLLAADSIINYSERLLNKNLPNLYWTRMGQSFTAKKTDNDIEKGMNIFSSLNRQELAYPNYNYENGDFDTSRAVLVGDSYGLGLCHRDLLRRSFKNSQFWFYNRQIHWADKKSKKLKDSDWVAELKSVDVVILLSTEATLRKFAFGFIDNTFKEFYPSHRLNQK